MRKSQPEAWIFPSAWERILELMSLLPIWEPSTNRDLKTEADYDAALKAIGE
jgi:hypothetical protein